MIKRKYRRTKLDSINQLAEVVNTSTLECRITTYHHFRFCDTAPGVVIVREFADSPEVEIRIQKNVHEVPRDTLPPTLSPVGMSRELSVRANSTFLSARVL